MASLKISTRQDKAAFLQHLDKLDIKINSNDIEDVKENEKENSYFIVHNLEDADIDRIENALESTNDIKITKLKEILRRMIREELLK